MGRLCSSRRVGGNVTAITAGGVPKWIEFARELVPGGTRIAVLLNPSSSSSVTYSRRLREASDRLGLAPTFHGVASASELEPALAGVAAAQPQVLIVDSDALLYANARRIVLFANELRLPAVYALREFVDAGGLLSYGTDIFDVWRRAAKQIDRILTGASPADIPIEQPTKFDLINRARRGLAPKTTPYFWAPTGDQ